LKPVRSASSVRPDFLKKKKGTLITFPET
jgi:hypothetical protein